MIKGIKWCANFVYVLVKWTLKKACPSLSFMILYTLIGFLLAAQIFIPQIEEAANYPRCNNPYHFSAPADNPSTKAKVPI